MADSRANPYPAGPPNPARGRGYALRFSVAEKRLTKAFGSKIDDRWGRVTSIEENSVNIVEYQYLGGGRVVQVDYPTPDVRLTYHHNDADGVYEGLDRFGRIIDQYWEGYGSTADVDRFHYTYDTAGNRLTRDIDSAIYATNDRDQKYTYDGLHRLTNFDRGTYNSGTGNIDSDTLNQIWTLDGLGNWGAFAWDPDGDGGTAPAAHTRTHNAVNELTGFTGSWQDPTYDNRNL